MTDISVVIPVWGAYCDELRACVEDVRRQGEPADIIVVNNASDVPLPPLPDDVTVLDLPVRVTVGAARNAAMAYVRTPYVLFADADDRLLPGTLQFLAAELRRRPRVVAVVGKHLLWNPRTNERRLENRAPVPIVYRLQYARRLLALCTLAFNTFPIVGCAAIRTTAVTAAGGFGDANMGEDWQLAAALLWRGPIRFHRRPTRLYNATGGSLWHQAHGRDAYVAHQTSFRRRLFADRHLPLPVRRALPLFAWVHGRYAARLFGGEAFDPTPHTRRRDAYGRSRRRIARSHARGGTSRSR